MVLGLVCGSWDASRILGLLHGSRGCFVGPSDALWLLVMFCVSWQCPAEGGEKVQVHPALLEGGCDKEQSWAEERVHAC